jgi:hypothetical protein
MVSQVETFMQGVLRAWGGHEGTRPTGLFRRVLSFRSRGHHRFVQVGSPRGLPALVSVAQPTPVMRCCCWFLGAWVSVRLHGPGFLVILHILDDLPSSRVSAPSLFGRGTPRRFVVMPRRPYASSTGTC